ncbi:hypothetical protein Tco_1008154, partial [Tanacetum coccineum]
LLERKCVLVEDDDKALEKDHYSGESRKIQALEQEMWDLDEEHKQMKMLKAIYGITTPQELRRRLIEHGVNRVLWVCRSSKDDFIGQTLNANSGPNPGMTPTKALTTIQTMADHSQKWHNGSSSRNIDSSSNTEGISAIVSKLDSEGFFDNERQETKKSGNDEALVTLDIRPNIKQEPQKEKVSYYVEPYHRSRFLDVWSITWKKH